MRRAILCVAVVVFTACHTTVRLTLHNPTAVPVDVSSSITHDGHVADRLNLGTIEPNGTLTQSFKIKPTKNIELHGSTNGYEVWSPAPVTVGRNPDPRAIEENVVLQARLPMSAEAVSSIVDEFASIGTNYGLLPMQAKQAAVTYLGSLLLVVPPKSAGEDGKILLRIPPAQFVGKVSTDVTYAAVNADETIEVTGATAANIATKLPFFTAGVAYTSNSLYQLSWKLAGFGNTFVEEPRDWNVLKGLSSLSKDATNSIGTLMQENSAAVLLYVNRIYAIRQGSFSVREGKHVEDGAKLGVGTFLTADGAWTFDKTQTKTQNFGEAVLNIGGEIVSATLVKLVPGTRRSSAVVLNTTGQPISHVQPSSDVKSPTYRLVTGALTGKSLDLTPKMIQQDAKP